MSFILDALRKSQASRQQHAGPGTIAVEAAPRSAQPHNWWAMVIIIVSVNLTVLAGFIYWISRDEPASEVQAQGQPENRRAPPERVQTGPVREPESMASQAMQPLPDAPPATSIRGEVRPLSAEVRETQPGVPTRPADRPDSTREAQTPPDPAPPVILTSTPPDSGFLPTLAELQLENRIALSPLHVDVHVFNEDPRRRFVLVNARKYKEGERLSEGPLLEAIRRDGLVMYYRGERFLVPRE